MYGTFYTSCFASANNQITGISQRLALESCMYQIDSDKMRCVLPYCPWTYPSIALRGGLRVPSQHSARGTLCDVCGCLQFLVLRCLKIQHSPIFCDVLRDVFCAASPTYAIESSSYWASQVYGRRVALRLHAPALSSCIGASCLQLCIALRFAKIVLLLYRQSLMGCSQETGEWQEVAFGPRATPGFGTDCETAIMTPCSKSTRRKLVGPRHRATLYHYATPH